MAVAQRLVAIAGLTIGEALRSRFLLAVLVLGLLAMLYFGQGQAIAEADQAKLLRLSISQLVITLAAVCTLFLCAFAIPTDIETRRIYTLVTKPASRGLVFLGRFLGFAMLGGLLLLALGILGWIVIAISTRNLSPDATAIFPRTMPTSVTTWGAMPGKPSTRQQPTMSLLEPHEAGAAARFSNLSRANFADAGPIAEVSVTLRVRPGRNIRDKEFAMLTVRGTGANASRQISRPVELQHRKPLRVPIPWEIVGDGSSANAAANGAGGGAVDVILTVAESPFVVELEPDSIVLLGAAAPAWKVFAELWAAEFAKLAFLIAVVVMFSTVFTPYTAILGGFFTAIFAGVAHSLRGTVAAYGQQLAHAQLLREKFGRPLEPTMAFAETVLGDPNAGASGWGLMLGVADIFPSFGRFALNADFVAGYAPGMADSVGVVWFFGFWACLAVLAGFVAFTLREIA